MSFDLPEPKKLAPDLSPEERKAMAPIDLLIRYIMPKLLDKHNALEWSAKKEISELRDKVASLEDELRKIAEVNKRLLSVAHESRSEDKKPEPVEDKKKPKRARRDAGEDAGPRPSGCEAGIHKPVALSDIAMYDPDKDRWSAKVIAGVEITAAVCDGVLGGVGDYPSEVSGWVYDLSDDELAVIRDLFPTE